MTLRYLIVITHLFFSFKAYAKAQELNISKKALSVIEDNDIYRDATVDTEKNIQTFDFDIIGLHPDKCRWPLRKLSRYEKFSEYLSVVKMSGYNDKTKEIYLHMDSALLPFPMTLNFKIDRIKKPGSYKFYFHKGFLKGLEGTIIVKNYKNRCFIRAISKWKGKKTKIPDTVFELFVETVGEMSLKKLFRISKKL